MGGGGGICDVVGVVRRVVVRVVVRVFWIGVVWSVIGIVVGHRLLVGWGI